MFGKKKELELQGKINNILGGVKETRDALDAKLEDIMANGDLINQELIKIKEKEDDSKRDLSYVDIVSDEMIKDIEEQSQLIETISQKAERITEEIGNREVFDTERISKSTDRILESIKGEDRNLGSIREEVRGLETISNSLKDMANQTSALSLNAAIMGARIESGNEGFVQTATEIKELAVECSKLIAELNRRIESINGSLDEADKEAGRLREAAGENNLAAAAIDKAYKDINDRLASKAWEKSQSPEMDKLLTKAKDIKETIGLLGTANEDTLYNLTEALKKYEEQVEETRELKENIQALNEII